MNPHVHAVFLDGAYRDTEEDSDGDALAFRALGHLSTRDVASVLERTRDRMTRYLRRRGLLDDDSVRDDAQDGDGTESAGLTRLAASAVSGTETPAALSEHGFGWRRAPRP